MHVNTNTICLTNVRPLFHTHTHTIFISFPLADILAAAILSFSFSLCFFFCFLFCVDDSLFRFRLLNFLLLCQLLFIIAVIFLNVKRFAVIFTFAYHTLIGESATFSSSLSSHSSLKLHSSRTTKHLTLWQWYSLTLSLCYVWCCCCCCCANQIKLLDVYVFEQICFFSLVCCLSSFVAITVDCVQCFILLLQSLSLPICINQIGIDFVSDLNSIFGWFLFFSPMLFANLFWNSKKGEKKIGKFYIYIYFFHNIFLT